jgi:hypothetical protein
MYQAPAVIWKAAPSRLRVAGLALLLVLCWIAAALYCIFQPWGLRSVGILLCVTAATFPAALAMRRDDVGVLRWDGTHWYWSGFEDQSVRRLVCVLDVQVLLVVRLYGGSGASQWLWLQAYDGIPWRALRRAVVSSQVAQEILKGTEQ